MWRRALAVVAAGLVLFSCVISTNTKGVVTGGIMPCEGIVSSNGPHYAAGTVTVLEGQIRWKDIGQGVTQEVLPTSVVAKETVETNATYQFTLDPGHYVLSAQLRNATVEPWVEVNVQPGDIKLVDVPNMCL